MIAIICPVHRYPQVVAAQIKNYASVHGDTAFHVLHPSIESKETFSNFKAEHDLDCDVEICSDRWQTSYYSALGAAISATKIVKQNPARVTHVYYHSDSDLLIANGFRETISFYGNGYSSNKASAKWHPYKAMMQDPIFQKLRESLSIKSDDIRIGRIEGCFFEIDIWLEMIEIVSKFYTRESIQNQQPNWPMEACLFPTIVGHFMKGRQPDCRNIVRAKPAKRRENGKIIRDFEENLIQIEDVDKALIGRKENKCIGLKWFSTDLEHPSRHYIKKLLVNEENLH